MLPTACLIGLVLPTAFQIDLINLVLPTAFPIGVVLPTAYLIGLLLPRKFLIRRDNKVDSIEARRVVFAHLLL